LDYFEGTEAQLKKPRRASGDWLRRKIIIACAFTRNFYLSGSRAANGKAALNAINNPKRLDLNST